MDNPKPKPKSKHRKIDLELAKAAHKKERFLAAYRKLGGKALAAKAIGVDRDTVWRWEQDDEAFREKVMCATEADTEELERIARKRAAKKSDLLMMFLLKGRKPNKYRDNVKVEHGVDSTVKELLLREDPKK